MTYIHELASWPHFHWDEKWIAQQLAGVRHSQGRLLGRMEARGVDVCVEATLTCLTEEVVASSEIEGEYLDKAQVRSSIARRLDIDVDAVPPSDRDVEGVVDMMLDATARWNRPLTADRLQGWHAGLFPTGRSGNMRIKVGAWRTSDSDPMQVVSGAAGKERIHYQAPPAARLDEEMTAFLQWFEAADDVDAVQKAAIAHLWFVTIHPFEDGNGRIARAIADLALARSERSARRFYAVSSQTRAERRTYYNVLEATQKGDLHITAWLSWFFACLDRAVDGAEPMLAKILTKAAFWEMHAGERLNNRQREMLNRLLDGFEGKLTSSKWALIAKTSQDTAARDIDDLLRRGILGKGQAGGRSTSYSLVERKG